MLRSLVVAGALLAPAFLQADETPTAAFERQLAEATESADVTVVHLWAPWCSDCKSELSHSRWSMFIAANPKVHFIFVTIWNEADGHELLQRNGVGAEPNFRLLHHPNGSRKPDEEMTELLGQPVSWIPSTWVFRKGHLYYALNYGELRFPMLQQMIQDSTEAW
ncbi:MAG TPA: thioredoxin family protein [Opitutaceae bacterium]|jgi:thiol-disulfide isomerase/thioredoxin